MVIEEGVVPSIATPEMFVGGTAAIRDGHLADDDDIAGPVEEVTDFGCSIMPERAAICDISALIHEVARTCSVSLPGMAV